jgi:alcohol dehydrogenase, propanol-preferring
MKAFLLKTTHDLKIEDHPLEYCELPDPVPHRDEILIRVSCCGICHTELDEIEGRTPPGRYPVIPGHQVIGVVEGMGSSVSRFKIGDRVGVAWIFSACGECEYCLSGAENLCEAFKATGRDANGGYGEYMTVKESFAYAIPAVFSDEEAAPLLCAGAIGYRSIQLSGMRDGHVLGLTGFGASGHLVLKMARFLYPTSPVIIFARSEEEQAFSLTIGASWAGRVTDAPPFMAHSIIDTTPVWMPVVESLRHLRPGGRLVVNAIRKESVDQRALLELDYAEDLWMEKEIKSVANITRKDVEDFLLLAARIPIRPDYEVYAFENANKALVDMKRKSIKGAKVLLMHHK